MSIDDIPIGVVFTFMLAFVLLVVEAGYRLGLRSHQRSADEKESPVSAMAGAVLGLGAFMLAFTFGIVSNRYDARKELVRNEANAIRATWLLADLLPEPDRARTRAMLHEYLADRLDSAATHDMQNIQDHVKTAERLQHGLWDIAIANTRTDMNSDYASLFIQALTDVISIHAQRVAIGIQARVPLGIWLVLLGITAVGMMAVGYQMGVVGSKRSMAVPMLAVAFALVIELIASLDRPNSAFINVTQQPLTDVRMLMESQQPAGAK